MHDIVHGLLANFTLARVGNNGKSSVVQERCGLRLTRSWRGSSVQPDQKLAAVAERSDVVVLINVGHEDVLIDRSDLACVIPEQNLQ